MTAMGSVAAAQFCPGQVAIVQGQDIRPDLANVASRLMVDLRFCDANGARQQQRSFSQWCCK